MKYLLQAAESGHRAAMIEIARALDSGGAGELCAEEGSGSNSRYYMSLHVQCGMYIIYDVMHYL